MYDATYTNSYEMCLAVMFRNNVTIHHASKLLPIANVSLLECLRYLHMFKVISLASFRPKLVL